MFQRGVGLKEGSLKIERGGNNLCESRSTEADNGTVKTANVEERVRSVLLRKRRVRWFLAVNA